MVECSKCGRTGEGLAPDFTEHTDGEWYCEHCYDFITKDDKCGCDKPPKEVFGEPVANFGIIMTALSDIKEKIDKLEKDQEETNKTLTKWLSDFAKELGSIESGICKLVELKQKMEKVNYII